MKTLKTVSLLSYLCKIIIQAISSLTVHDNLWALKVYSFSKFQNVISDSPHILQRHYDALRTKIDMWLALKKQ